MARPEIQERYASGESFRELSGDVNVSHETIRGIVQRSIQGAVGSMRCDKRRRQGVGIKINDGLKRTRTHSLLRTLKLHLHERIARL